jgi:hypothetical protein
MAMHQELPAANLLETVFNIADAEFLTELDEILRAKHFLGRRLRAGEARRRTAGREWLSPEIRPAALTLSAKVPVGNGKAVRRENFEYPHIARYLKVLNQEALAAFEECAHDAAGNGRPKRNTAISTNLGLLSLSKPAWDVKVHSMKKRH